MSMEIRPEEQANGDGSDAADPFVSPKRLRALRTAVGSGDRSLLIAIHDYPDPDAIAAALAMQTLAGSWGVGSTIAHGGVLGREENAAMVRLLKIDLKTFSALGNLDGFRGAVLLDTQPAARNQSLPEGVPVLGIIDHHDLGGEETARPAGRSPRGTTLIAYSDVRLTVGASSTLMAGYLAAAGLVPDERLATALFLGIKTDTDGLLRDSTPDDVAVYTEMMRLADLGLAAQALHPPLDLSSYRFLHAATAGAGLYGSTVIADCGEVETPDLLSLASDYLIPLRGVRCALAVGFKDGRAFLSLRAKAVEDASPPDATRILLRVVEPGGKGGGHTRSAGGFLALDLPREKLFETIRARLLDATGDNGNSRKDIIA